MNNFYDYLKSVYTKEKVDLSEIDISLCIALTKWLSFDKDTLYYLKYVVSFLFYVEPLHYYYLLYSIIPKRRYAPFIKKIDKEKNKKEEQILIEIQKYFDWSDRELSLNRKFILSEKKYWEKEFGIK